MNDTLSKKVSPKRLLRCLLLTAFFLLLFFLLLPSAVKWIVNHVVLPRRFSDPACPLKSARLADLRYTGLVVSDLQTKTGLTVPRMEVAYGMDFSSGVAAVVSGRCARVTFGGFNAGPFDVTGCISRMETVAKSDIPLQDGLFHALVDLQAVRNPDSIWNCTVQVPLADTDSLSLSGVAKADISGNSTGTLAVLSLAVKALNSPEHNLSLSNLNTACTLRFPGELRSQPAQELTADSLAVGDLRIEKIRMHYQLEPGATLFVEDMEFGWCRGTVSLYGARFSPEKTDISVHLFCDRLSLEQVLAACGLTGFSAGGELNGKLPLQWTKDGLQIDHGFLFTTPGKGGQVSFGGAKAAAGILPPGTLDEGQIGLVTAALASFDYDWITMTLNTEGENVRIEIEADGQPGNILPFEYDDRSGTYVKIVPEEGRGIQQPMLFKLNLTIPLNQLLCYASGINRQWNLLKGQP